MKVKPFRQAEIIFKDGTKDWIDPIGEYDDTFIIKDNILEVHQEYGNVYKYTMDNIKSYRVILVEVE